jgi:diaminopimelate decarboxylase
VLRTLARRGAGADIVSGGELARALAAGIPAAKIVFSGVGKLDAEIDAAISAGVRAINVESAEELGASPRAPARWVGRRVARCA